MGIYIKDMEMPTSCWECPMVSGYEIADEVRTICSTVRCRLTNTKRPAGEAIAPDCPLAPVPPHGRLIDADAVLRRYDYELSRTYTDDFAKGFQLGVKSAVGNGNAVVIEAEEGELQKLERSISGFYERHEAEEGEI